MWQPLTQPGSLSDRIANQVMRLVLDERLKPGDQLPSERDMAVMLAVSRPSLREGVRTLQARGLLIVKHGKGVFVAPARPEHELRAALVETELTFGELYAMREVLEVPAAGWAAEQASDEALATIRAALDVLNAASDAPDRDYERLQQLHGDFHESIASATGNRFLRQTSHVLRDMIMSGTQATLLISGRVEAARTQHEHIYAAIAARDPATARRIARSHIEEAGAAAVNQLEIERHGHAFPRMPTDTLMPAARRHIP